MKNYIITGCVCILLGLAAGSQLFPKVKEKTVEVEKIVKDIQTVTRIITKPDGTKEELITIVDRSKESKTNTKVIAATNWHISIKGSRTISDPTLVYGLQVERRIIGDLYLGASINTDKQIGATIGVSF
jgi:hypothetical protein